MTPKPIVDDRTGLLDVLVDRAARGVLTPVEGAMLRAAVAYLRNDVRQSKQTARGIQPRIQGLAAERNAATVRAEQAEAALAAVREQIAHRIRAELVCCYLYGEVNDGVLEEDAGRRFEECKRDIRLHDLCYWGEASARIAEDATLEGPADVLAESFVLPADVFGALVRIARHVSAGRGGVGAQEPYPDAAARWVLGRLDDVGLLARLDGHICADGEPCPAHDEIVDDGPTGAGYAGESDRLPDGSCPGWCPCNRMPDGEKQVVTLPPQMVRPGPMLIQPYATEPLPAIVAADREAKICAYLANHGFTVVRTEPVEEVAAERGTVARLLSRLAAASVPGDPDTWRASTPRGSYDASFPVITDESLPAGEVHLRPRPKPAADELAIP